MPTKITAHKYMLWAVPTATCPLVKLGGHYPLYCILMWAVSTANDHDHEYQLFYIILLYYNIT